MVTCSGENAQCRPRIPQQGRRLHRRHDRRLTVKGFAKPVRTYRVVGLYDDLVEQGRIIRKEQDGRALAIDRDKLTKKGKAEAIKAIKDVLSQLED